MYGETTMNRSNRNYLLIIHLNTEQVCSFMFYVLKLAEVYVYDYFRKRVRAYKCCYQTIEFILYHRRRLLKSTSPSLT